MKKFGQNCTFPCFFIHVYQKIICFLNIWYELAFLHTSKGRYIYLQKTGPIFHRKLEQNEAKFHLSSLLHSHPPKIVFFDIWYRLALHFIKQGVYTYLQKNLHPRFIRNLSKMKFHLSNIHLSSGFCLTCMWFSY